MGSEPRPRPQHAAVLVPFQRPRRPAPPLSSLEPSRPVLRPRLQAISPSSSDDPPLALSSLVFPVTGERVADVKRRFVEINTADAWKQHVVHELGTPLGELVRPRSTAGCGLGTVRTPPEDSFVGAHDHLWRRYPLISVEQVAQKLGSVDYQRATRRVPYGLWGTACQDSVVRRSNLAVFGLSSLWPIEFPRVHGGRLLNLMR